MPLIPSGDGAWSCRFSTARILFFLINSWLVRSPSFCQFGHVPRISAPAVSGPLDIVGLDGELGRWLDRSDGQLDLAGRLKSIRRSSVRTVRLYGRRHQVPSVLDGADQVPRLRATVVKSSRYRVYPARNYAPRAVGNMLLGATERMLRKECRQAHSSDG